MLSWKSLALLKTLEPELRVWNSPDRLCDTICLCWNEIIGSLMVFLLHLPNQPAAACAPLSAWPWLTVRGSCVPRVAHRGALIVGGFFVILSDGYPAVSNTVVVVLYKWNRTGYKHKPLFTLLVFVVCTISTFMIIDTFIFADLSNHILSRVTACVAASTDNFAKTSFSVYSLQLPGDY